MPDNDRWESVKQSGSAHYKGTGVEPIDLYRDSGMLRHFAICSIIKYAHRNRDGVRPINHSDMIKIKHYADMLMAIE